MNLHSATDRLYARQNMRENALMYWYTIRSTARDGYYNSRIKQALWYLQWAIYWRNRSKGISTI